MFLSKLSIDLLPARTLFFKQSLLLTHSRTRQFISAMKGNWEECSIHDRGKKLRTIGTEQQEQFLRLYEKVFKQSYSLLGKTAYFYRIKKQRVKSTLKHPVDHTVIEPSDPVIYAAVCTPEFPLVPYCFKWVSCEILNGCHWHSIWAK